MTLTAGTKLGPYEIIAPLGAGGMGEVFRARDTRLDREVAIKVLPGHLSANAEVRARFEREAKTISSLNHPHICTLFDVGREGDTDYLVMELVEGETLAQRLEKGALPGPEVLDIGRQIADALDRAHRAGVIHRDLKPGNVMLTRSGAKLLDFGLARATGMAGPGSGSGDSGTDLTQSPTMAAPLTAEGTILGTFQYMAPEQLEGHEADARSDLWALGCVLYEMATGRRAFEGKSQASLISSVMGSQPAPMTQVAPLAPAGLERLVQACLAKDPAERLQSAHDIRMQLAWLAEGGSQAGVPVPVASRRPGRKRLPWMLAAAGWMVALAMAAVALSALGTPPLQKPFFATVQAPPTGSPVSLLSGRIALSPDGSRLATVQQQSGKRTIEIYQFHSGTRLSLENTQGGSFPFWSPDSRWIGFFADGKLRKIEARGGPAQSLADAYNGRGGSWNRNGVIVFAPDIYGPLMKVSENGGAVTPVTRVEGEGLTHRNPNFLPDSEFFLFTQRDSKESVGRLMVGSLDGAMAREILSQSSSGQFSAGYLLFVRDHSLLAQRFDHETLTLSGPIVPLAEDIAYWNPRDLADFSVTAAGLLAFREGLDRDRSLAWYGRDGRLIETPGGEEDRYTGAMSSRDLSQVGLIRREPSGQSLDVWLLNLASGQKRRMTFLNASSLLSCVFAPDGQRMAVSNWDPGRSATSPAAADAVVTLQILPISGTGSQVVKMEANGFFVTDWSPDGKYLLGWSQRVGTGVDITVVPLDNPEGEAQSLISTPFSETNAMFSPDGGWVAYQSNESGSSEVYVVDFPQASRKWQVSLDGGLGPAWSTDGRELFFLGSESGSVMAAPVALQGDKIELGPPKPIGLSHDRVNRILGSDGQRFLVLQRDSVTGGRPTHVIRNWPALMEQAAR